MTDPRALVKEALKPRVEAAATYMPKLRGATDLVLARPDIIYLVDPYGDHYLDFTSGAGIMPLGWAYRRIFDAANDQIACYAHAAELGQTNQFWETEYAKQLSDRFPKARSGAPQQVLYTGSGDRAKALVTRLLPGEICTPWNQANLTGETAALVLEFCSPSYQVYDLPTIEAAVKQARTLGVPVVAVETNTGFGRCGTLWAQEEWGVVADMTVLGEAGGAGFAWGALVADPELFARAEELDPLILPGNEIACAAGNVLLSEITEPVLENVRDNGYVLESCLAGLQEDFPDIVEGFRGIGLNYGLVLTETALVPRLIDLCRQSGVITSTHPRESRTLRMTPPLIISDQELRRGVDRVGSALMDLQAEL